LKIYVLMTMQISSIRIEEKTKREELPLSSG